MPSAATPSLCRVALRFKNSGLDAVNVIHGLIGDGGGAVIAAPTLADLSKLGDLVAHAWANTIAKQQHNSLSLIDVSVVQATVENPVGVVRTLTGQNLGLLTGDEGLQAACVVQQLKTGIAAKGANGRIYWSGIRASAYTGDGVNLNPADLPLWNTNVADFYNGMLQLASRSTWTAKPTISGVVINPADVDDYTFGIKVYHRSGARAGTFDDLTATAVATRVGIQRRRMR